MSTAGVSPDFEASRARAYRLLGDALDELRGWNLSNGLTTDQFAALIQARRHIAQAKDDLNRAAS